MAHVISFRTAKFDVSKETPNPTNPIAGQSVLEWLRPALADAGYQTTAPSTEDWGWYMDAVGGGASYIVGASADAREPAAAVEWTVQIHRHRSFTDRLAGRNRLTADDALSRLVERLVRADAVIDDVSVDWDSP